MSVKDYLRSNFLRILSQNNGGNVVDELIMFLDTEFILLHKERESCRECFHYNTSKYYGIGGYCVMHKDDIVDESMCLTCTDFLSGKEEAQKSIARIFKK